MSLKTCVFFFPLPTTQSDILTYAHIQGQPGGHRGCISLCRFSQPSHQIQPLPGALLSGAFSPRVLWKIGRIMMTISKISVNCLGLTSITRVMSHYQPKLHASLRDAKGKSFKIYHRFYPYVKFDPPFPWVPWNDPCKTSGSLFLRV